MGTNFNINNEFKRLNYSFLKAQRDEARGGLFYGELYFRFLFWELACNKM